MPPSRPRGGKAADKYLRTHAEAESAIANELPTYRHVMVVPCCDEESSFIDGLLPAARDDTLCIVVINGDVRHEAALHQRNLTLLDDLLERSDARPVGSNGRCSLGRIEQMPVLLVDRCREGARLPARRGVGLARKIGCDIAFALRHAGKLESRFIHWTDADVLLPAEYFAAAQHDDAVLLLYPYRHVSCGDAALDRAHAVYEAYLRYYVLGLRFAGSPYALHTVGSTLAVDSATYAHVRGVPPRDAAEDFYLVNKVIKLGRAVSVDCEPIAIRARHSLRVPFGTGRAARDIVNAGGERNVYDPRVFSLLRSWLKAMLRFAQGDEAAIESCTAANAPLEMALTQLGYAHALRSALEGAPEARRVARAHEWFDAFKTLKLIHGLRDGGLPDLPWRQALAEASFVEGDAVARALKQDDPSAVCNALFELEHQLRLGS